MAAPSPSRRNIPSPGEIESPEGPEYIATHATSQNATEVHLRSYLTEALRAILAISSDGRIVFMSGHAEQIFGYAPRELFGKDARILLPERCHSDYRMALQAYFLTPTVRVIGADMALTGVRKDGTEFPIEIGISHVDTHEGMIALGFVSDTTDRTPICDELSRANAELRRSNSDLDQFAYVASHDLQAPLRRITNYLQLLERRYRGVIDAEADEFILFAVDGAASMKQLINDLLRFARLRTAITSMALISAKTILQDVLVTLDPEIVETRAVISFNELPSVFADPGLLRQVFQNLIGNAIKFHSNGSEPDIHISSERKGNDWIFSVRDNGIGILPQHLERIFRIFDKLHAEEEFRGSGIGLAICRRIIERHGGRIWATSMPEQGSIFSFSIPIHSSD